MDLYGLLSIGLGDSGMFEFGRLRMDLGVIPFYYCETECFNTVRWILS